MPLSPNALRDALTGVIGFPVTPFQPDLSVDLDALRQNVRAMLEHPLAAIVAAGGTGELYPLTPDEHLDVVGTIVEEARGKLPVIAGTGFSVALGSRAGPPGGRGRRLRNPGVPAVLPRRGRRRFAEVLHGDWRSDAARPAHLQPRLVPSERGDGRTPGGDSDAGRVEGRSGRHPAPADHQATHRRSTRWIGGAGDDLVPAYYAIGIRAFTSSVANVSPQVALELHEAGVKGDYATLERLMTELVVPLYALRARRKGHEVTVMKELMTMVGLAGGAMRPPLVPMRPEEMEELRAMVPAWQKVVSGRTVKTGA